MLGVLASNDPYTVGALDKLGSSLHARWGLSFSVNFVVAAAFAAAKLARYKWGEVFAP